MVRSAFVEALEDVTALATEEIPCSHVTTPGARLASASGSSVRAGLAGIEWARQRDGLSAHAGRIESPELRAHVAELLGESRLWSPTQLESYAKCPWAYFSGRLLRLDRLEDPDQEMDAATRGSLLHDALEPILWPCRRAARHARAAPREARGHGDPARRAVARRGAGGRARQEVARQRAAARSQAAGALAHSARVRRVGDRAERADVRDRPGSLPKRIRTGVHSHELALGEIEFSRGDIRIKFRGFVDRVEIGHG